MAEQFTAQVGKRGTSSFATLQVRTLVGGRTQRNSLRALVAQLVREELGGIPAPIIDLDQPTDVPAGSPTRSADAKDARLSGREREVLEMLVRGLPNKEIARLLFIADRTVKWHANAIYRKLNVTNRTEAVGVALQRGLVSLDTLVLPRHAT
jgi:DNA-binding NarL/FixJ family response regulator